MRRQARWAVVALLLLAACGGPPRRRSAALDTLRRGEPVTVVHVLAPGETLRDVASLYYGDPGRAADLAAAAGLAPGAVPPAGTRLRLTLTPEQWQRARALGAADAAYNAGVAALDRGDLPAAAAAFREALALDPRHVDARYNLALVLLRRGRYEQAAAALARVLAARPGDRDARLALAGCRFHQARFADAIDRYRSLLRENPRDADAAYGLARSLAAAGRRREARRAWRAFLALEPDGPRAAVARRELAGR